MLSNCRLHQNQVIGCPGGVIQAESQSPNLQCPDIKAAWGGFAAVPCQSLHSSRKEPAAAVQLPKQGSTDPARWTQVCVFPMEMETETSLHPAVKAQRNLLCLLSTAPPQWQSCLEILA